MARHRLSAPLAQQPPAQAGRRDTPITLDAFVSTVYPPHVKVRKRSWRVDERIARQHLSPAFGDRRLADIQRHEMEDWLHGLSSGGLAPATCNRILAVFKTICSLAEMRGVLPRARACLPSKSTRNANAISRGRKRNALCGRWQKSSVRKPSPSACFY